MLLNCYALKDEKAEIFLNPFFFKNVIDCVRSLTSTLRDVNNPLFQFASEYSLYMLCQIDDETGVVQNRVGDPLSHYPVHVFGLDSLIKKDVKNV